MAKFIELKTDDGKVLVNVADIAYIEPDGEEQVAVKLTGGEIFSVDHSFRSVKGYILKATGQKGGGGGEDEE